MEKHITKITSKSIEQSGLTTDYKKAISEYIWNGFDAGATHIDINFDENEIGHIFKLIISDNGEGINLENIDQTFGQFLDSQKRSTYDNSGFIKGKKGKGRFSFSIFANKAIWHTRYKSGNEVLGYDIEINRSSQNHFDIDNKIVSKDKNTGTKVIFEDCHSLTSDLLDCNEFTSYICSEFGWFLFLNKQANYSIKINGIKVDYWDIIDDFEEIEETFDDYSFQISFIRWKKKIGDKYYYYFLNEEKKEKDRKHTSFNNKAIDFHHSVYVQSDFFNDFEFTKEDAPVLDFNGKNQTANEFRKLIRFLNKLVEDKEKEFVRESQADKLITDFHTKNIFPKFKNNSYDKYREKDLEKVVKELYCVQPNIFIGLKDSQSKTIVGFLNLLLDTDQREYVLVIIDSIVKLTEQEREELAKTLKRTNFSQVIKLVKMLESRFEIINILKTIVFDLEKFSNERDHIQKIIESNYWLFGEQYHLVSADKNFETLLNNYFVFNENQKPLKLIDEKNKLKRPDIFICRQNFITDSSENEYTIEENIIVELKRPSIIIGKTQYSQVEDYLLYIKNEPRFNSQLRKWKFILIGKEVDSFIVGKYESQKVKGKKFLVESTSNYEIYTMTWDDLFKIFDSRHRHLIEKLEFKESIIEELKEKGYHFDVDFVNELTKIAVNQ